MFEMDQNNIKTFARLKPLQQSQKGPMFVKKRNSVLCKHNGEEFKFNQVFDQNDSNYQIYKATYGQMIDYNFNGYNSCILAYGQTSSGKTHTMKGTELHPGIIPLCINSIFNKIKQLKVGSQLSVSYFEIYNQNVFDLLSNAKDISLQLGEQKKVLTILNLTQKCVQNSQEAMKQFQFGETNRKFADNNINLSSSRSHVIFRINLKIVFQERRQIKQICSQINMVDLAGSEGVGRTKAEGHLKKQGENINKSILALSNVIRSMSDKNSYTNFRDSKLTRILQSSLCHNAKSIIICTLNVNQQNLQESLNTLRFCNIASKVQILSKQNMKSKPTQVKFRQQEWNQNTTDNEKTVLREQNNKLKFQLVTFQKRLSQKQRQSQQLVQKQAKYLRQIYQLINQKQMLQLKLAQYQHFKDSSPISDRINEIQQMKILKDQNNQHKAKYQKYKKKYNDLIDQFNTVSRNQKCLVDQLNAYKDQIRNLKEVTQNKTVNQPKNCDKKSKQNRIYNFHSSPFDSKKKIIPTITLETVILLRQTVLNVNRQLMDVTNQNGELRQRINYLETENQKINQMLQNQQQSQNYVYSQSKSMKVQKHQINLWQFNRLKRKVADLKKQNQICRQREEKAMAKIKKTSKITSNLFDQYQQWKYRRDKSIEAQVQTQDIPQLENNNQEYYQLDL